MLRCWPPTAARSLQRIRQGELDEHALQKLRMVAADMKEWPLYLDDSSFLTINQLRGKARRMKDRLHRPADHRLSPAAAFRIGPGQGQPPERSRRNFARDQGAGQGAGHSDHHPGPAQPPLGGGQGRARAAQPARIGRDRAGRRRGACLLHRPDAEKDEDGNERQTGPVIPYVPSTSPSSATALRIGSIFFSRALYAV
jgi:hypothetical protein